MQHKIIHKEINEKSITNSNFHSFFKDNIRTYKQFKRLNINCHIFLKIVNWLHAGLLVTFGLVLGHYLHNPCCGFGWCQSGDVQQFIYKNGWEQPKNWNFHVTTSPLSLSPNVTHIENFLFGEGGIIQERHLDCWLLIVAKT